MTAVRRTTLVSGLLVAGVLLAACGSQQAGDGTGSARPSATTQLTVTARMAPTAAAQTWTLTCDPAGGSHPDPTAACAELAAATDPFSPTPADRACTMIYGGAQTATITGTYRGRAVDASYQRSNGCEIARWDAIATVLVIPGGA
ncbi:MAG TPA: SSI family serine proteinase inhibitor [Actinomycetes bacterium]